jgi:hypothetical protein
MFVTEFGWATAGTAQVSTTREGQARRLRSAYRALLAERVRYRLAGAYWFNYRDRRPRNAESGNWWGLYTGLFTRENNPKPAWAEFARFAGGEP